MKIKQKHKILIVVFCCTLITTIIFWLLGYNFKLVIGFGVLILFMVFALWDTPPKHKDFSDKDRRQATLGGSPLPELWTPDMSTKGKIYKGKKHT